MIEYKQLFYHKPKEGEIGDCWRTCIACVLNLRPEDVPHPYLRFWDWADFNADITQQVQAAMNEWFVDSGLAVKFVEVPVQTDREGLGVYLKHYYPDMHVIVGCNSKHGGHSVIMRNDDYMWDPSRDNSGCVGPMDDGYYWIGLLVSRRHF